MQSKLIIVDPGHFHATLLQKDMYPWVDPRVTVYAPLGPDLLDYLNRISLFNSRPDNPTRWALDIHTSNDPMAEMLRGHAGNIVVFTGRNRGKIDRILAALQGGAERARRQAVDHHLRPTCRSWKRRWRWRSGRTWRPTTS